MLERRAAPHAGDPGALDRAVDGGVEPEQPREVWKRGQDPGQLAVRDEGDAAIRHGDDGTIDLLQDDRVNIDELPGEMQRADLAPAAAADHIAPCDPFLQQAVSPGEL